MTSSFAAFSPPSFYCTISKVKLPAEEAGSQQSFVHNYCSFSYLYCQLKLAQLRTSPHFFILFYLFFLISPSVLTTHCDCQSYSVSSHICYITKFTFNKLLPLVHFILSYLVKGRQVDTSVVLSRIFNVFFSW